MSTREIHVTKFGSPADVALECNTAAPKVAGPGQVCYKIELSISSANHASTAVI